MLGFLTRWLSRRRQAIFHFWDGVRRRRIDPMVAYRALLDHPTFDWETTPKLIDVPDERLSLESLATTTEAVRIAFNLPNVEEGGLTAIECVALLTQFCGYLNGLKKSTRQTPTSRGPSVPPASVASATSNGSASGSIAIAPSAEGPSAS